MASAGGSSGARQVEQWNLFTEIEGQAAVVRTERAPPDPDDLTGRHELVEDLGAVGHAGRQHVGLENGGGDRSALQLANDLEEPIEARLSVADMLPTGQELAEGGCFYRFDLGAELGERPASQPAQHVGIHPFLAAAGRQERSAGGPTGRLEPIEHLVDHRRRQTERPGCLPGREGTVGTGESADDISERVFDRFEEGIRDPLRKRHTERIAQPGGVFDGGPPFTVSGLDADDLPIGFELADKCIEVAVDPRLQVDPAERTEVAEQVVDGTGRTGMTIGQQPLQFELDLGHHLRVEQAAQLGLAEQLGQQAAVEGEGGRPALGGRSVVLIHVGGDEVERERRGEGTRRVEGHVGDPHLASPDVAEQLGQSRQVEVLLQDLSIGLEHDGKGRVVAGDLEQIGRAAPLQPERGTVARAGAGAARAPGRPPPGIGRRTGRCWPPPPTTSSSSSSGSTSSASAGGGSSASGNRNTMPSSVHMASTS